MSNTLINKSRRMVSYNLDTTHMVGVCGQKKKFRQSVLGADGVVGEKRIEKMICGSLTIPSRGQVSKLPSGDPLPDEILKVPAIAADIRARVLVHKKV